MRVFLTGATGFVGSYVLRALLDRGHRVRCLIREGTLGRLDVDPALIADVDSSHATVVERLAEGRPPGAPPSGASVEIVYGDVTDLASIQGDMHDCDAAIHLVGIIDENRPKGVTFERVHVRGTRAVVEEAKAAGVRRFVHMSANGADPDADSPYQATKGRAEEIVREAGFAQYVLFRPSIIFGDPGGERVEFASRLADTLVRPFPVLPILGDGQYETQPVHVTTVAAAFVQALELPFPAEDEEPGRAYCVAGRERVTFDETVDRIARALGRAPKRKVHQPLWLAKALVRTAGEVGLLPISPAQFAMLVGGNTCDPARFYADFDVPEVAFTPEHLAYLKDD